MLITFNKTHIAFIAILLLAIFIAYANIYHNPFLFDDEFLIIKNNFLRNFSHTGLIVTTSSTAGFGGMDSFYRPLQGLLYLITYQMAGLSTAAFHLLNLLLHGLNAVLLFTLGVRIGFRPMAVFFACLLWALHPMHTEAVTYMSATADTLYTSLCLAGLLVVLPDFSTRKILLAAGVFALAIGAKETALVFPLLVMACLFFMHEKRYQLQTYFKTWPLWLVAIAYVILRMTILKFDGLDFYKTPNVYTESILVRFYTFLATLPDYAALIIWPHDLHMEHAFPVYASAMNIKVMLGAVLLGASTAYLFIHALQKKIGRNGLTLCFALLWFFAAHALHTGLALPVNSFFLEHWMYMPSMGLFLCSAEWAYTAIDRLPSRDMRLLCLSLVIVAAGTLGIATFEQNKIWADPITFYSNIIEHGGENGRVHNNIAMAYDAMGDVERAKTHYEKAIALHDTYAQTHYNLALLLLKTNDVHAALEHLDRSIILNPKFTQSYDALIQIYTYLGDKKKTSDVQKKLLNK
jgi:protein O-mannosyl-transferase